MVRTCVCIYAWICMHTYTCTPSRYRFLGVEEREWKGNDGFVSVSPLSRSLPLSLSPSLSLSLSTCVIAIAIVIVVVVCDVCIGGWCRCRCWCWNANCRFTLSCWSAVRERLGWQSGLSRIRWRNERRLSRKSITSFFLVLPSWVTLSNGSHIVSCTNGMYKTSPLSSPLWNSFLLDVCFHSYHYLVHLERRGVDGWKVTRIQNRTQRIQDARQSPVWRGEKGILIFSEPSFLYSFWYGLFTRKESVIEFVLLCFRLFPSLSLSRMRFSLCSRVAFSLSLGYYDG